MPCYGGQDRGAPSLTTVPCLMRVRVRQLSACEPDVRVLWEVQVEF